MTHTHTNSKDIPYPQDSNNHKRYESGIVISNYVKDKYNYLNLEKEMNFKKLNYSRFIKHENKVAIHRKNNSYLNDNSSNEEGYNAKKSYGLLFKYKNRSIISLSAEI